MKRTDAFRVLASADRQLVLHELVRGPDPVTVDTLSQRVAARRHRVPPGTVSDAQAERAQIRLVHQHFPQLEERDLIAVDWKEREVSLTDSENVDALLDAAGELEQWPPNDLLDTVSS